jgi:hypothetical protein
MPKGEIDIVFYHHARNLSGPLRMPFDLLLLNTREWRLVAGRLRHKLPTLNRRPVLR